MKICLDYPTDQTLSALAQFSGWIQYPAGQNDFSFALNGMKIDNVKYFERPDVPKKIGMAVIGWSFIFEMKGLALNRHGSVTFTVCQAQIEAYRHYFFFRDTQKIPLTLMIHIPKTAGTSLRTAVQSVYPPAKILFIYDDPAYYSSAELTFLSPTAFDDLNVIYGHFGYGLHKKTSRDYEYIAILRPPLEFVRSYVFFMKYVAKHELFVARDVIDIVKNVKVMELDNCYVRFMSGRFDSSPIGIADLEVAQRNIERDFAFIGSVEFIEASAQYISEHLGRPITIGYSNATPNTIEHENLDLEEFEQVARDRIKYDLLLYERVMQNFHDKVRPHQRATSSTTPDIAAASGKLHGYAVRMRSALLGGARRQSR